MAAADSCMGEADVGVMVLAVRCGGNRPARPAGDGPAVEAAVLGVLRPG